MTDPGGRSCLLVITSGPADLRVFENEGVKLRRFLGVIIEPQKRRDFLRDLSPHIRLVAYATDSLNAPWARLPISSSVTSSWCVAIDQEWPNGSVNIPYRSPQNMSANGMVTSAPAFTAFSKAASTSATNM